jgi:general secretion pathway protein K
MAPRSATRCPTGSGKIDLNTARGGRILGLLLGNQVQETRATSIAQAILDWRAPDSRRRPDGAEDRDYAAAGRPHGARAGLFESIDELQQAFGMTTALYRRMQPDLTVGCRNAGADPLAASPAVLAAIPNLDPLQAVAWLTGDPERPYAIRRWRRAAAEVLDE